jgi:hypothetical protein
MDKKVLELINDAAMDITETVQLYRNDPEFFKWGLGNDEDSNNAVEHYKQVETFAPQFPPVFTIGAPPPPGQKKEKARKTYIGKKPQKWLEQDNDYGRPIGETGGENKMVGEWSPQVGISHAAQKDSTYNLQMLNAISQEYLNAVDSFEVEAMALVDRCAISVNEENQVENIKAKFLNKLIANPSPALIKEWQKSKHAELGNVRSTLMGSSAMGIDELTGMAVGANLYPDQRETLQTTLRLIAQQDIKQVGPVDATSKHSYFSNPAHANKIVVVNAILNSHAEQNLAVALLNSGYDKSKKVAIAGGKRPCTICFFSLCMLKEVYPNLMFNTRPGGYYIGETVGGLWHIALGMGLSDVDVAARAKHYLGDQFISYVTAIQTFEGLTDDQRRALGVVGDMVPRDALVSLKNMENHGLLTTAATFRIPPQTDFEMKSFGEYTPNSDADMKDS